MKGVEDGYTQKKTERIKEKGEKQVRKHKRVVYVR